MGGESLQYTSTAEAEGDKLWNIVLIEVHTSSVSTGVAPQSAASLNTCNAKRLLPLNDVIRARVRSSEIVSTPHSFVTALTEMFPFVYNLLFTIQNGDTISFYWLHRWRRPWNMSMNTGMFRRAGLLCSSVSPLAKKWRLIYSERLNESVALIKPSMKLIQYFEVPGSHHDAHRGIRFKMSTDCSGLSCFPGQVWRQSRLLPG